MGSICGNLKNGRKYKKFCIQHIIKYRLGNVTKHFSSGIGIGTDNQLEITYILRLSKYDKELLSQFIEEEKLDMVDTAENIISDICKYHGFAMNMYKYVVNKIVLLDDLEECNENDYEKMVLYSRLLEILE